MHTPNQQQRNGLVFLFAVYAVIGCQDVLSSKTSRQNSTANALVTDSRPNSEDATPSDDSDKSENKGESNADSDDSDGGSNSDKSDGSNLDGDIATVTVVSTATVTVTATETDDTTCVVVGPKPDPKSLDPAVLATCDKFVLIQIQCDWLPPPERGGCHLFKKKGKKSIPSGSDLSCEALRKVLLDSID